MPGAHDRIPASTRSFLLFGRPFLERDWRLVSVIQRAGQALQVAAAPAAETNRAQAHHGTSRVAVLARGERLACDTLPERDVQRAGASRGPMAKRSDEQVAHDVS